MPHHLSDEDIQFFADRGYLVVENLLDPETVESMRRAIDEIVAGAGADLGEVAELEPNDPSVMRRIWSPSKRHEAFRNVQEDPRILDRLEGLIGPDIMFHHSKLNMKGPRVGSPVAWHQDLSYYPHTNSKLIACIIYLDDASEENGCVRVLSGSHKGPICDHTENGYFRGKVDPSKLPEGCTEIPVGGPAGCGIFLHCKVLHRSEANTSNRYRRCFIPAYRAADSLPIYFGPHAAHNEPGVYLLRGRQLGYATAEPFQYPLPIAEKPFNSLFAVQQGEHVAPTKIHKQQSGYATAVNETM